MEYKELIEKIIGCAYKVYNKLVGLIINFGEQKVDIKRKVKGLHWLTGLLIRYLIKNVMLYPVILSNFWLYPNSVKGEKWGN